MDIKLKPITEMDAKLIYDAWGCNGENFKYLSVPPQKSIDDAATYIKEVLLNSDSLCFHICERKTEKILGIIKAKVDGHKALVGYVVDRAYWSKGVATQALKSMLDILNKKPTIVRIWATCATDNPASSKVLENCGFVREALLKKWIVYPYQGSQPHDNYSYYYEKSP